MNHNILVVLPCVPYPLNSGGNQGVYHMVKYLRDYLNVFVWFPIFHRKQVSQVRQFKDEVECDSCKVLFTEHSIGFNKITSRGIHRFFDKLFLYKEPQHKYESLLWGQDKSYYHDLRIVEDINKIIIDKKIELVDIEFMPVIKLVNAIPSGIKKLFIHHELQFVKFDRFQNSLVQDPYNTFLLKLRKQEEISSLNEYDKVVTLTETDKEILKKNGVTCPIEVSPLFIPAEKGYPEIKISHNSLVFIGGAKHLPNVEGLNWYLKNVHPIIVNSIPNYRLYVVGTGWDNVVPNNNIVYQGFVDDLSSFLPGKLMIVPLLTGSGMRMKILESVNNSIPFVSTTVGAEGMEFSDGKNCFIKDTPKEFAESILRLWNNEDLQRVFIKNAREHYESTFSREALGYKRLEIIKQMIEK